MRPRLAHGAVLLALALATPTLAAPRPVCKLLTDATGDATPEPTVPNREAIDIVSADVATGRHNLVAVVRLASLVTDPTLAGGRTYRFSWLAGRTEQEVAFYQFADGTQWAILDPDTAVSNDDVKVKGVVDVATSSIVWTVQRKQNPVLAKKGTKLRDFEVKANPAVNVTGASLGVDMSTRIDSAYGDQAASGASYVDGTLSCVKGV